MLSERPAAYWQRVKWVEPLLLLIAAPFLLFPERYTLVTFVLLALLGMMWLAPLLAVRSALIPPTPFNAALLVFCLALCTAIAVTAYPYLTLPKATGVILGLGVWRYIVIAVQKRSQVPWAAAGYILFGLGFILLGLLNADWLLKTNSQVPFLVQLSERIVPRSSIFQGGIGIHPNQIAGTITLVFPLLIALLVVDRTISNKVRWLVLLATVFCGVALLFTQSRSGWIGTLGGLLLMLVLWSIAMDASQTRRTLRMVVGLLITLLLIVLIGIGPQRLQDFWLEPPSATIAGSFSTLNMRRDVWPWAIQTINDFPFSGIGLGSFRQAAKNLYPIPVAPQFDFAHAHNVFLQLAVDLGIPGLIAYMAILFVSLATAWKILRSDVMLRGISIGLISSLVAFHIYGLADTLALGSKPAVLIWALLAMLAVMVRLR